MYTTIQIDNTMDEDEVVKKIKSITHHLSIDTNMILDVAYVNSFSIYFEHHLQQFYEKGFTRNITTYLQYSEVFNGSY